MQLPKWIAPCRVQLRRCRFAMRKGVLNVHAEIECPCRNPLLPVEYEHTGSYSNEICRSAKRLSKFECSCRNELPHAAFSWEGTVSQWEKVYWMSMPKLNAPAEIHCCRSNMNTRDPILMKSVEVLKDCRSLNAAAEMNCPMPRSVEKVPFRNEKRCNTDFLTSCDSICPAHWLRCRVSNAHGYWIPRSRAPDRGPSQSGANGERQSKLSTSKNLSILTSLPIKI